MTGGLLADQRYELVAVLGEGAQGTTFEAFDRKSKQTVAIKRFNVRGAKSWKDVELAEREASVLSALSHPNLPRYRDHFEEDGALYLVMDKIEGQSLETLKRAGGVLNRDDAVPFLEAAEDVLTYLRRRAPPVIHRDINPKNVIRRPDGSYAFVDFGAVRDRLKPQGSTVVGTFGYMAPEQFQGRALPASDVYAVGATALTLLCGAEPEHLPHRGLSIDVAAALRDRNDPELVRVLAQMLEPDPDRRRMNLEPLRGRGRPAPRRSERHSRRRARIRERGERRRAGRRAQPVPPFMLFFALIGLGVASIAISAALLVAVPVLLSMLSLLFGQRLRDAARAVQHGGHVANRALGRARSRLLGHETEAEQRFRVEGADVIEAEAEAEQYEDADAAPHRQRRASR